MIADCNFVTPESEGIRSEDVIEFIDYLYEVRANVHSFIIARHGSIVAEGYYKPFDKDTKKRLYSCTKSIVSMAVGKLYGEGLVELSAPIVSYFPRIKDPDPVMAKVTVEDVLTMTVPTSSSDYCDFPTADGPDVVDDGDWTEKFFHSKAVCDKPAGRLFKYNSHGSCVLADLVRELTGKNFLEYLRPELDKIGVSDTIECLKSPTGCEWGSSGALATTRDFAKIGELLLNLGEYKGEELLPRDYMERATSALVGTAFDEVIKPGSYGYGYQIWREPYGFGMHGMRGQVVYCFPDRDFLVVMNSNEPDYAVKLYYAASRLYKRICDTPLPENRVGYEKLQKALAALKIDRAFGAPHSPLEKDLLGRSYKMNENPMGLESFTLELGEECGILRFTVRGEEKRLPFGWGEYVDTAFPDKSFYGKYSNRKSGREFRALVTGSWQSENRLLILADVSDQTPGSLGIVFEFEGDSVALEMRGRGEGILGAYNVVCSGRREK